MIGKKIHYKFLEIEFEGTIGSFIDFTQMYQINITHWIGSGYPHLKYYLSGKDIEQHCKFLD